MPVFATSVIFGVFAMPTISGIYHWNLPAGQYLSQPCSIVQECQSYSQFHKHNFWSQTLPHDFEPFLILLEAYQEGGPRPSFHTPGLDAPYFYKLLHKIIALLAIILDRLYEPEKHVYGQKYLLAIIIDRLFEPEKHVYVQKYKLLCLG